MITKITRQLSFDDIKPKRKMRYEQILERLMTGIKTALEKMGLVKTVDKKICKYTGKKVAVYEITSKGIEKKYTSKQERTDR